MLEVVSAEVAAALISENIASILRVEEVSLEEALLRTAAEDIFSPENLPAFPRSTVDGYAVNAADTYGCSESIPAMLVCDGEIRMGETPKEPLSTGHCIRIATGGRLPDGANAVSMIEYTDDIGDEFRYISKPVSVLENVNNTGDDCRQGSLVLEKGTLIRAKNIAVLAALGISSVNVRKRIKAGIISTGDEIIDYVQKPVGAQIRNINSIMLASRIKELGCEAITYPIVKDNIEDLSDAVKKAASECDIVFLSGGSSVGEKDNTFKVLDEFGEIFFHGISVKPGKPTMFAVVDKKPVMGLPGHPQAAFFVFEVFAVPALEQLSGQTKKTAPDDTSHHDRHKKVIKKITHNIPSNHGREELVPVRITGEYAEPLHAKSGVVSVLSQADGYIRIGRNTEGLKKDSNVEVYIF